MRRRKIKAGSVIVEVGGTQTVYEGHEAHLALEEIVRERAGTTKNSDVVEDMIKLFPKGFK